jgi:GntR family transcriptional repressor for pyruvate dehydrogenase complex
VKALSLINVLDVRQGDGTYVTSLEPAVLLHAMGFVTDFHRDEAVLEFLEVRRILEPAAAALAAARMTVADAADLRAVLDKLGHEPSVAELVANDLEFHRRIGLGSGNQVLCSLIDGLSGPRQRARIWRELVRVDAVAPTLAEHREICDAIGARQPDIARSWATVHIAGIERRLRDGMTM